MQLNESEELLEEEKGMTLAVGRRDFTIVKLFSERPKGLGKLYEAKLFDNIVGNILTSYR